MAVIESTVFDETTPAMVKNLKYGENWPVVYILNNDTEAYIGETVNASVRSGQHWGRKERRRLTTINLIGDDRFNKSVILDLESFLISHMAADGLFRLQNSNMGCLPHNYYQQEEYEKGFDAIWNQLKERDLIKNSLSAIRNSDIFKYSPYKSLTSDQYTAVERIVSILHEGQQEGEGRTVMVKGGAGSGKTVLAIYLMKLLTEAGSKKGNLIELDLETDP